ncbi:hypothetical protein BJV78DRAFT_1168853 [Lactifluus subvellereus]|nr:hypothetical protein BJV78DRAFT_1168853 [Lactifluus subvellereus]
MTHSQGDNAACLVSCITGTSGLHNDVQVCRFSITMNIMRRVKGSVLVSPFYFSVTAETFNFGGVVFGAVTIFAVLTWWLLPEDKCLRPETLRKALAGTNPTTRGEDATIEATVDEIWN